MFIHHHHLRPEPTDCHAAQHCTTEHRGPALARRLWHNQTWHARFSPGVRFKRL